MAYTLSNLLQDWANLLGLSSFHVATGGSATTAVVGGFSTLDEPPEENYCNDWTMVVARDAGGAGASPEGKFSGITSYASDTYTYTFGTMTDAIASGDTLCLVKNTVSLQNFISIANQSLKNLGKIALRDISLTADGTHLYNLPAGVRNISKIDYLDDDGLSIPVPRVGWSVRPYTAGGTAVLEFLPAFAPLDGQTISIWYEGVHPTLTVYNSEISDTIEPSLMAAQVAYDTLVSVVDRNSQLWKDKYELVVGLVNTMIAKFPIRKPKKQNKILVLND